MATLFLRESEALKKGLTVKELEDLEVVGHWFPPASKKGSRSIGEPLYRTADIERIRNARQALRS